MADLKREKRATRRLWGTRAGLLALLVSGCMLFEHWSSTPVAFSHQQHDQLGLECGDCHAPAEGSEPVRPEPETCLMCHDVIDEDKPVEQQSLTILAQVPPRPGFPEGIHFEHARHGVLECDDCHSGIAQAEVVDGSLARFSMADCTSCHEQRAVAGECESCHSAIGIDSPPASHASNWKRLHGEVVRAQSGRTADDCNLCHTPQGCLGCHKDEAPVSHNNTWRLRTHGVAAVIDRESCTTCHQVDSCNRCHSEVLPISHRGSFGGTRSTHCLTCHFPVGGESCVVCHKGTPSHLLAAPKPDGHSPQMNCRQCHGIDQPLPHVDNGSDCNFCHK